jgi:hypothetical protein
MNLKFFRGRKWIAIIALATAMAATGIYGATTGKLPFEQATPSIKVATRSEASAGRGYSARRRAYGSGVRSPPYAGRNL